MSTTPATERPGAVDAWNMRLVGHSDLNGHGDGMHVNLKDGYAFVAHMGDSQVGTSVVDVSDPTRPRVVAEIETPAGTHSHKVQVVGDVLIVNHERYGVSPDASASCWSAGIKLYDVSKPDQPREVGFLPTPGKGVHRPTYWEPPYAYLSGTDEGFTDQFLIIADVSDPSRPREVGRWWMPGMHAAGSERPTWPEGRRYALHHALVRGDRAYCGWWDAGLVILDIADKSRPKLASHLDFGARVSGCSHTALPIPGKDVLIVTDESTANGCQEVQKQVRVVDISDERNPKVVALFPVPEGDFCTRGGRFGPHNLHEMRPGTLVDRETVYLTYFNAGIRLVNIADRLHPREVGYFIPEAPPGRATIQLNDLIVGADGLIYVTDRFAGGLYILERTA